MRFRLMQMSDIPEAVTLYQQSLDAHLPDQIPYPQDTEQNREEFTLSIATNLISNPNWFAICGVVGSTLRADDQNVKHVIGGKVKSFIAVSLSRRTIGAPKNIAFTELLVVDDKYRGHDIARKLVQLMAVECAQRGAQVLEAGWTPGSLGAQIWERLGCLPYRVLGAWILPDGTPRHDLPMVKEEPVPTLSNIDHAKVVSLKRRGRPPKVQHEAA